MKSLRVWVEPSFILAGLIVVMAMGMWAERTTNGCVMPDEAQRTLVLSRDVDAEHLAADIGAATRIAQRYGQSGPVSSTEQSSAEQLSAQQARLAGCEASLAQDIATRHALPRARVHLPATAFP
jgi:hypothetical protein